MPTDQYPFFYLEKGIERYPIALHLTNGAVVLYIRPFIGHGRISAEG